MDEYGIVFVPVDVQRLERTASRSLCGRSMVLFLLHCLDATCVLDGHNIGGTISPNSLGDNVLPSRGRLSSGRQVYYNTRS